MTMPSRTSREAKVARGAGTSTATVTAVVRMAPGAIGKVVCTKDFHCVRARDSAVFYKVLAQLK